MIQLPRGNPVKENLDPGRINLPDALKKLHSGAFSGYLRFEGSQATSVVIFEQGRLISALLEGERERLVAAEALARTFALAVAGGARLDIYRLSSELALSLQALLHGEMLFKEQELKLIDIKALLGKLREDRLDGCLRIYTDERIALIFYRQGAPLGFFHDGSTEIETSADTSMSVARLPGAKVDVLSMRENGAGTLTDLAGEVDLVTLWQQAKESLLRQRRAASEEEGRSRAQQEQQGRQKLLAFLRGTAEKHIGRIGVSLVEKEFDKTVPSATVPAAALEAFYDRFAKGAKLVAGPSKVAALLEEMRRGSEAILK